MTAPVYKLSAYLLPFLVAVLALLNGFVDYRSAERHKRSRAKVAISLLVCICTIGIVYQAKSATDERRSSERKSAEAIHSLGERAKAGEQAAKDARQAAQNSERASGATLDQCVSMWRDGAEWHAFVKRLPAEKREILLGEGCGPPPAWRPGGRQIRMITALTKEEAEDRKAHLLNVLGPIKDQNWTHPLSHITPPAVTRPTERAKRDHSVYVVTLNEVEPSLKPAVCSWLECVGVPPGEEACDVRDLESSLGKFGKWPGHGVP